MEEKNRRPPGNRGAEGDKLRMVTPELECLEQAPTHKSTEYSPHDQQLFAFKYNKWKVLWRVGHICLALLICYKIVFEWSLKKDFFMFLCSEIVGGMALILMAFSLYDVLFTHEIILYRSKIAKTWRVGLGREVEFACSKFGAMKTPFCSTKRFYPYWIKNFFTPILGVFYDETLAGQKDVRRMNQLLSEISGRDISFFTGGSMFATRSTSLKSFLIVLKAEPVTPSPTTIQAPP